MDRQWKWRTVVAILLTALSVLMLLPTFVGVENEGEEARLPKWYTNIFSQRLTLGLDLQGGVHLQYKVDIEEALARKTSQLAGNLQNAFREEYKIDVKTKAGTGKKGVEEVTTLTLTFPTPEDTNKLDNDFLRKQTLEFIVAGVSENVATLVMTDDAIEQFSEGAISQAIETIERRVNEFGVAESSISKRGDGDLVVQLPGVKEQEFAAAKEKLSQTGQLHFQIVDRQGLPEFFGKVMKRQPSADNWPTDESLNRDSKKTEELKKHVTYASNSNIRSTSREILEYMVKGQLDQDHVVGYEEIFVNPKDKLLTPITTLTKDQEQLLRKAKDFSPDAPVVKAYELHYMFSLHGMSGENVEDANVGYDSFNRPVVQMRFNQIDADRFYEMTKKFTQELMAIMIDDVVYSAPRIKEPIGGGRVQIELGAAGAQAQKEATALVAVLKSGALQAPLRKIYDSQVGATLGEDSIESGKFACLIGTALVVVFMLIYYKMAGILANGALLLNILFIFAGLTAFGATLTLPGIAGIVLTVGMAVDANVLIFERIREEVQTGVAVRKAIELGYEKALSSILDANITTLIAAIVLYQFGSGPIRGFAVTLAIGIISSVYTAVIVTRLAFQFIYCRGSKEPQKISI